MVPVLSALSGRSSRRGLTNVAFPSTNVVFPVGPRGGDPGAGSDAAPALKRARTLDSSPGDFPKSTPSSYSSSSQAMASLASGTSAVVSAVTAPLQWSSSSNNNRKMNNNNNSNICSNSNNDNVVITLPPGRKWPVVEGQIEKLGELSIRMGSSGQLEIYFSEAQPALDIRQGDIVAELNEIQGEILANRQVLDGLVLNRKVRTLLLKASKPQHVTIVYDTNELGATYVDERTFFQFSHLSPTA